MQLPADASKDAAIVAFSSQISEDDPEAAYRWAETVGDPARRQSAVYSVLNRWIGSDPANAATMIQQSSLSDQQKAQLMQRASRN